MFAGREAGVGAHQSFMLWRKFFYQMPPIFRGKCPEQRSGCHDLDEIYFSLDELPYELSATTRWEHLLAMGFFRRDGKNELLVHYKTSYAPFLFGAIVHHWLSSRCASLIKRIMIGKGHIVYAGESCRFISRGQAMDDRKAA